MLSDLVRDESQTGRARLRAFLINKGPWSRLDHNRVFVPGAPAKPAGATFYPAGASKAEIDPPSPFIVDWASRLAAALPGSRRALDIAIGRGRHVAPLARLGLATYGVDVRRAMVRDAVRAARTAGLCLRGWCADLRQPAIDQFVACGVGAGLERHEGLHRLTAILVRHAHDGRLFDRGMLVEDILDLTRPYFVA